jgi:hypothetical protein
MNGLTEARLELEERLSELLPAWGITGPTTAPLPSPSVVVRPAPYSTLDRVALRVFAYPLEVLALIDSTVPATATPRLEEVLETLLLEWPDADQITPPAVVTWGPELSYLGASVVVTVHACLTPPD